MDIVEIDGQPKAKRGKWSGSKSLWRCPVCFEDRVTPRGRCPDHPGCSGDMADLMAPLVEQGRIVGAEPPVREIRRFVLDQVARLEV